MENDSPKKTDRFFLIDWLISIQRASANREKLFLYIFIGVLIAIIYILSMLVIKQYIQRRNLYRKVNKPDLHEYDQPTKKQPLTQQKLQKSEKPPKSSKSSRSMKSNTANSTISLNQPKAKKNNDRDRNSPPSKIATNSSRISKSSNNIYTESSSDMPTSQTPMINTNYERLNNHFNPNFASNINANSFVNHSHSNLCNYNNDLEQYDKFEGFKLITRNGSTKIVNGQNDDISEYEIPIIRYNDRSMQQQYMN